MLNDENWFNETGAINLALRCRFFLLINAFPLR